MGDVFDAMNRSNKERDENKPSQSASNQPEQNSADSHADSPEQKQPESGFLPVDQVEAKPLGEQPREDRSQLTAPSYEEQDHGTTVADAAGKKADEPDDDRGGDNSVTTAFEKSKTGGMQVVPSSLPDAERAKLNGYALQVVVHHDRGSVVTEQYRAIRTLLLARSRTRRLHTHVVTSSTPEEGKSVTAINLGVAFSELRNQKTLLIEGDLRRPAFEKLFDRRCDTGIMQALRGEEDDIDKIIQPTVYDNLQFIPAGGRDPNHSTELLTSPRMVQLLDRLKDRYDHIFFDSPPVITVTDACILGQMCDSSILVLRLNKTPSDVVDRAKRLLRASNCEITGVVLTHLKHQMPRYLYRYDRYGANYR